MIGAFDSRILVIAAAGSVLALDRRAAVQMMLAHPVVASTLVGALLGELQVGLAVGLLVGLLWSGALPVGGVVPADETLGAVVGVGVAALAARPAGLPVEAAAMAGFIGAIPAAILGRRLELLLRRLNGWIARRVEKAVLLGDLGAVGRGIAAALASAAVAAFVTQLALLAVLVPATRTAVAWTPGIGGALIAASFPVPLAGAAAVLVGAGFRMGLAWAALGYVVGTALAGVGR